MNLQYTKHATQRQAHRNLSHADVDFVWTHGRQVRSMGALHIFLGRRDIPTDKATASRYARLQGTTLVLDDTQPQHVLITVYRNRRALKRLRCHGR